MQQTTNFGFNKPDGTDFVTDDKFWKENWDKLDGYLGNMPQPQKFTATNASISANQIILGQTNNVNQPTSTVYLASANALGVGMDQYGNLLPINPSAVTTGSNWHVTGKGGTTDFQVFLDGTHKVATKNNVIDDGTGNQTIAGSLKVNEDNSVISADTGTYRLGIVKKANQGPVLAYSSGTNFYVQRSSQTDLGDGNINGATMTTVFGMDGAGNVIMPLNTAHTITGTNTNVTMAANTDTLLPFLPGSPTSQPGEGQWNNGVFTAPADGYYLVSGYVRVTTPLNSSADVKLWKYSTTGTGTFVGPIGRVYNANQSVTQDIVGTGTLVAHLLSGETMKLYINASNASTTVNMANSRVTVVKVG